MNLFPWIAFLPKGFENGIIQKVLDRRLYKAWGSISLFGGFLENENSLETLNVIFENVPPKGSFWLKMKYFRRNFSFDGEFSIFAADSRS